MLHRLPFEPDRAFIARKPFSCAGVAHEKGDSFDKDLVSDRRLWQMWKTLHIDVAPNSPEVVEDKPRIFGKRKKRR